VLLAVAGAASLYATGRVGAEVGAAWAVLPARVVGVVTIAVPLAAWSRLRLTRPAVPLVVTSGICEVLGFALFTLGAAHGIAVSSVLVSEFGAIAAIAAFVLFRERLAQIQLAGVPAIVLGVGALSALQA
jgi:drug/metabolite transporter (DMT)-like permease